MRSAIIGVSAITLFLLAPPPPAHGQVVDYVVSGTTTASEVTYGSNAWLVPTNYHTGFDFGAGGRIEFTISGNAVRAGSASNFTTTDFGLRQDLTNQHQYYIPPGYMQGNKAKCIVGSDEWCRMVIHPLHNPGRSGSWSRNVVFTVTGGFDEYGEAISGSVSGTWTFTIKDTSAF